MVLFRRAWLAPLIWIVLAGPAYAQNSTVWTTNYYAVTGDTIRDIHRSLGQARPWKRSEHDAVTQWRVEWHLNYIQGAGDCRLTTFSTRSFIQITLPKWTRSTNAAPAVAQAWDNYVTALVRHERGHGQMAIAAAAEMHKRVKAVRADANCEALKSRINGLCQQVIAEHKQHELTYDKTTNHGQTQGARLWGRERPTPPDSNR